MRVAALAMEWPRHGHHSGGVGRYVFRLVDALKSEVEFTVFCPAEPYVLEGVNFEVVDVTGRISRYYTGPGRARHRLQSGRFDLVHAHGDDWPLLGSGLPVVRTVYGLSAHEARTSTGVRRWNHWLQAGLEELAVRHAAAAVAIGPDTAKHFNLPIVPPVISDRPLYLPVEWPSKERQAVFVGTFGGRKQGWLAVRGAERLRAHGFGFVVFGPESDRDQYPSWVDFRAGADDDELWAVLRRSRVLLAPSTYEGFGIPMWEAMANGCCVVGLHNPGADFLLQDTAASAFVVSGNQEFEAATHEFGRLSEAEQRELARNLSTRALAVQVAGSPQQYLDLYRSVLANDPERP